MFENITQNQRNARKSLLGMYGKTIKKRLEKIAFLFQEISKKRKEKIERSFVGSKQLHELSYRRFRG